MDRQISLNYCSVRCFMLVAENVPVARLLSHQYLSTLGGPDTVVRGEGELRYEDVPRITPQQRKFVICEEYVDLCTC